MQMHLIIAILFGITAILAFFEDRLKEIHKIVILAGYAVFMVFLATTKDVYHTADALAYENMFYKNDDIIIALTTEPTYIYLSRIVLALGGSIGTMFFIYAILAIPAKIKIIYSITPYVFTALLIYIPVYFEVHDLIQIRVSAAAMFLLASTINLADKKFWQATLLVLIAILFHYSAIAYLPFLFIGNRKFSQTTRIIIAILVPVCFAMYLLKKDLLSFIPSSLGPITYKLEGYKENSENGNWDELYPLYANLYYLAKCTMLYLCLIYYEHIVAKNRLAPIMIALFSASTLFLPAMATIPVIAGRISDLYGIVDCIVFTFSLYLISPRYAARIGIAIAGAYMLVYNMINTEYFT